MKLFRKIVIPAFTVLCIFLLCYISLDNSGRILISILNIALSLLVIFICSLYIKKGRAKNKLLLFIFVLCFALLYFLFDNKILLPGFVIVFCITAFLPKIKIFSPFHKLSNIQDPVERTLQINHARNNHKITDNEYYLLMSIASLDQGYYNDSLQYNEKWRTGLQAQNLFSKKNEMLYLNNQCLPLLFLDDIEALKNCVNTLEPMINKTKAHLVLASVPKLAQVKIAISQKETEAAQKLMEDIHNIGSIPPHLQMLSSIYDAILFDLTGQPQKALGTLENISLNANWLPIRTLADECIQKISGQGMVYE